MQAPGASGLGNEEGSKLICAGGKERGRRGGNLKGSDLSLAGQQDLP